MTQLKKANNAKAAEEKKNQNPAKLEEVRFKPLANEAAPQLDKKIAVTEVPKKKVVVEVLNETVDYAGMIREERHRLATISQRI